MTNFPFPLLLFCYFCGLSVQNILLERCLFIFSISIGPTTVDIDNTIEIVTQNY